MFKNYQTYCITLLSNENLSRVRMFAQNTTCCQLASTKSQFTAVMKPFRLFKKKNKPFHMSCQHFLFNDVYTGSSSYLRASHLTWVFRTRQITLVVFLRERTCLEQTRSVFGQGHHHFRKASPTAAPHGSPLSSTHPGDLNEKRYVTDINSPLLNINWYRFSPHQKRGLMINCCFEVGGNENLLSKWSATNKWPRCGNPDGAAGWRDTYGANEHETLWNKSKNPFE